MTSSSNDNKDRILINARIGEVKKRLDKFASDCGVKAALVVLDHDFSKVTFACAFPSNEKLEYAVVGFQSSFGNKYIMFEDVKEEEPEPDEKKKVPESKRVADEMIGEKLRELQNMPNLCIKILKERVSLMMKWEELCRFTGKYRDILKLIQDRREELDKEEEKGELEKKKEKEG